MRIEQEVAATVTCVKAEKASAYAQKLAQNVVFV